MLVANPDGYQYTFDHERLWRKNLRDNDGDGQITRGDGVDPNRNFPSHWGYDNEGSSAQPDERDLPRPGRGLRAGDAGDAGPDRPDQAEVPVNYHSFGQWLLYPQGWQDGTLDADDPIYSRSPAPTRNPAIPGFDPGRRPTTLYVTNGETTDYADTDAGTVSCTPELERGLPGLRLRLPRRRGARSRREFQKTLPFDLDLARVGRAPGEPGSHRSASRSSRST